MKYLKKFNEKIIFFDKIELLNDFDIFRDEDTDKPVIIDRLNDFLLTIGKPTVKKSGWI